MEDNTFKTQEFIDELKEKQIAQDYKEIMRHRLIELESIYSESGQLNSDQWKEFKDLDRRMKGWWS